MQERSINTDPSISTPAHRNADADADFSDALKTASILIVDDNELNRLTLEKILESRDFTRLLTASNGKEALDITLREQPDIVILDLLMPEMDGFEYCLTIRGDPDYKEMVIIAQTALDNVEERNRIFDIGATDLVIKPIYPDELIARITLHYERILSHRKLAHYHRRMQEELELSRAMQFALLPSIGTLQQICTDYPLSIHSHFAPSIEIGGDIWGLFPLDDTQLAVYLCDFAGHGITAAINTFRLHSLMLSLDQERHDPSTYLDILNEKLIIFLPVGHFATFFYGIFDLKERCLRYAAAGAPPPILYRAKTQQYECLNSQGVPLGVMANSRYKTHSVPFAAEDILCLYSDALIETAVNEDGKFLSEQEIADCIGQHAGHSPDLAHRDIVRTLIDKVYCIDKLPLTDDLTICLFTHQ